MQFSKIKLDNLVRFCDKLSVKTLDQAHIILNVKNLNVKVPQYLAFVSEFINDLM